MNLKNLRDNIISSGLYRAQFVDVRGVILKHVIIMVVVDDTTPTVTQYSLVILGVEGPWVEKFLCFMTDCSVE